MPQDPPIVIAHPIDSDIRLVQIGPGYDPADEPLLAHAGLACELGGKIEVAMSGMTGISDKTRQFLTTIGNDLTEKVLTLLAEELSDPVLRASTIPIHRRRMDQIKTDLNGIPVIPKDLMEPPTFEHLRGPDLEDGPEP